MHFLSILISRKLSTTQNNCPLAIRKIIRSFSAPWCEPRRSRKRATRLRRQDLRRKQKGAEFFPLSHRAHPLAAHYLPALRPACVHVGILTSGRGRPAANGTLVFWKPTTLSLAQTRSTKTSPRNPVISVCPTIWQIASRALPRRRITSAIRERDRSTRLIHLSWDFYTGDRL